MLGEDVDHPVRGKTEAPAEVIHGQTAGLMRHHPVNLRGVMARGLKHFAQDAGQIGYRVAEYLAHIPDTELLQAQLHRAVQLARERAASTASTLAQPDA